MACAESAEGKTEGVAQMLVCSLFHLLQKRVANTCPLPAAVWGHEDMQKSLAAYAWMWYGQADVEMSVCGKLL